MWWQNVIKTALFIAGIGLSAAVSAQGGTPDLHQVQAVIDGVRSPQHAYSAALILQDQPGVVMCRVDHNTRNLLMHVAPACPLDREQIDALLEPLEMDLRCYHRAALTNEPFHHLDPHACGYGPEAR